MHIQQNAVAQPNKLVQVRVRQCDEFVKVESFEKKIERSEYEKVKGDFELEFVQLLQPLDLFYLATSFVYSLLVLRVIARGLRQVGCDVYRRQTGALHLLELFREEALSGSESIIFLFHFY